MWISIIVSLVATGLGLFVQANKNQATAAAGEKLAEATAAQNALNAAIQDAEYFAKLEATQKEIEAAQAERIANERRTNQIITAALLTVFIGLIGVAIFKLKR